MVHFKSKVTEILSIMNDHNIQIVALQETLRTNSPNLIEIDCISYPLFDLRLLVGSKHLAHH